MCSYFIYSEVGVCVRVAFDGRQCLSVFALYVRDECFKALYLYYSKCLFKYRFYPKLLKKSYETHVFILFFLVIMKKELMDSGTNIKFIKDKRIV